MKYWNTRRTIIVKDKSYVMHYRTIISTAMLLILTNLLPAQQVIRDSTYHFQVVLPSGFQLKADKSTEGDWLYSDDNGSSFGIRFERTEWTQEQIAMGMDEELMGDQLAAAFTGFEKIKVRTVLEDNRSVAWMHFNFKTGPGDSAIQLRDLTKTFYHDGYIITLAFITMADIFPNYRNMYTQFFSTFTHDFTKVIEPVPISNGHAYLSGAGCSVGFPGDPVFSIVNELPSLHYMDEQENVAYDLVLWEKNTLIGSPKDSKDYLEGFIKGYHGNVTERGSELTDTALNGYQGHFWPLKHPEKKGMTIYTFSMTSGNAFLSFSVTGEEKKLSKALARFIGDVKRVEPVDLF